MIKHFFWFCITDASLREFSNFLKNLEEQREILVSCNKNFKKLYIQQRVRWKSVKVAYCFVNHQGVDISNLTVKAFIVQPLIL